MPSATVFASPPVTTNPPPKTSKLARLAPAALHPLSDARQRHFFEIAARAQRMQPHPVAHFAGDPQHRLADRGDRDRHHRQPGRLRREIRGHQGELVMLAPVIELAAGLPTTPHRTQRPDVVAQPRCGRAPRDAEAALVVAFDLAAETQHEAPVGVGVQVPGLARHHRRTARERDGDRRRQLDALGRERGKGERRKDVVPELDGHQRVEPHGLRRRAERRRLAPMPHRQHCVDAHCGSLPSWPRTPYHRR